jgi:peptidoglycan/xylan/chitin deacetylase (PgdA/CDA1 family)
LAKDVVVLCYHAVSATWPSNLAVRPSALEAQAALLLDRGYEPVTFHRAVTAPPRRCFSVTFDDGFRSVLEQGLPVLEPLGVPATVFVSSAYADAADRPRRGASLDGFLDGPHAHELLVMPWEQLRQLADRGWEIGSHAVHHPLLTGLDDEQLAFELRESRRRIEEALGRPCLTLAYPTGDHDVRVARFAREAGYEAACTLPVTFPRPAHPLMYPRISVQRDDTLAEFRRKTSRMGRFLRTTPLAHPARRVYVSLRDRRRLATL